MDAKTTYAQTSDAKFRTYLNYRRDMKQKAIAELEILDWLKEKVGQDLRKSGGDHFLWFLRKGNVTREPDYRTKDKSVEFQYAEDDHLNFFDFTVSKIAKKMKLGKREPYKDRLIFYIIKNLNSYALLEPEWIFKNGKIGEVPAWRKDGYRVPKDKFLKIFKKDAELEKIIKIINAKNKILQFQHQLIDINKERLAHLLEKVIDEEKIVEIVPNNLTSFFRVCFILDNLNKGPRNANLWFVYLMSFVSDSLSSEEMFEVVYCLDFLYPRVNLKTNEINVFEEKIKVCFAWLKKHEQKDGTFKTSAKISLIEDTRHCLFIVNTLEDLVQDSLFYYQPKNLQPITKIYQSLLSPTQTAMFIEENA